MDPVSAKILGAAKVRQEREDHLTKLRLEDEAKRMASPEYRWSVRFKRAQSSMYTLFRHKCLTIQVEAAEVLSATPMYFEPNVLSMAELRLDKATENDWTVSLAQASTFVPSDRAPNRAPCELRIHLDADCSDEDIDLLVTVTVLGGSRGATSVVFYVTPNNEYRLLGGSTIPSDYYSLRHLLNTGVPVEACTFEQVLEEALLMLVAVALEGSYTLDLFPELFVPQGISGHFLCTTKQVTGTADQILEKLGVSKEELLVMARPQSNAPVGAQEPLDMRRA